MEGNNRVTDADVDDRRVDANAQRKTVASSDRKKAASTGNLEHGRPTSKDAEQLRQERTNVRNSLMGCSRNEQQGRHSTNSVDTLPVDADTRRGIVASNGGQASTFANNSKRPRESTEVDEEARQRRAEARRPECVEARLKSLSLSSKSTTHPESSIVPVPGTVHNVLRSGDMDSPNASNEKESFQLVRIDVSMVCFHCFKVAHAGAILEFQRIISVEFVPVSSKSDNSS